MKITLELTSDSANSHLRGETVFKYLPATDEIQLTPNGVKVAVDAGQLLVAIDALRTIREEANPHINQFSSS